MSQQIGAPPQVSVETTPPSHTTRTTSSASHSSMPPGERFSAHIDPSVKPPSDSSKTSSSGTTTGKVEIPKLSAATTELLARVTGSVKGGEKRDDHEHIASWSSSQFDTSLKNSNWDMQGISNMKASSAFLELPPSQFAPGIAQFTTGDSVPAPENYMKSSAGLINLVPKTAGEASSQLQSTPATTAGATPVKRQSARQTAINGTKRTNKRRKRADDDEEGIIRAGDSSSDESDITPMATQTKSGRQVHRPSLYMPPPVPSPSASKRSNNIVPNTPDNLAATTTAAATRKRKRVVRKGKEVNISCINCQRGHSPLTNTIVFCDSCNRAWHQLCHDPRIDDEVVQVKEKEWLCKVCKPVPLLDTQPTVLRSYPNFIQSKLTRIPIATPPLEVGGAGIPDDQRRGYLSSLSHAALVDLLATLSDRNPDLPMFPENLKILPSSKFSFQSSISTAASDPSASNPKNAPAVASSIQEPLKPLKNGTSPAGNGEGSTGKQTAEAPPAASKKRYHEFPDDDDESDYEVFEDHRLYPRAGNGLRLSLQQDDLDILREDPGCPTFSYSLHGLARYRAEVNDAAPVWGTA